MALSFPNPSRSYDASRHCVCFWGYDNTREVAFQVSENVLMHFDEESPSPGEADFLASFDRHRDQIVLLALDIYAAGSRNSYTISS
ncbi:DUF1488 family protein [Cupriavidus pauculus]|uniref:DUF1488 domain-containing protein n=1 Tax=Cupriavidus pauculus TaxID=82633 RepID=A0A2N5CE40_9BURK|nr:DUF1488 domain-containing protein [Cupriavidus pauculus]PLQ00479.1 DUF1488 domain-containing protein [Cupriavidus pauculus]